jgi:DNA-binding MarR family transcriptional regulator
MENEEKHNNSIALISLIKDLSNKIIVKELMIRGYKDICPSHGEILYNLYKYKNLNMKDLARYINKDKSTLTVLVKKLEKLGYLEKTQCSNDARVQLLSLSEKAVNFYPVFQEVSFILNSTAFKGFIEDEIAMLSTLLSRVIENMNEKEEIK